MPCSDAECIADPSASSTSSSPRFRPSARDKALGDATQATHIAVSRIAAVVRGHHGPALAKTERVPTFLTIPVPSSAARSACRVAFPARASGPKLAANQRPPRPGEAVVASMRHLVRMPLVSRRNLIDRPELSAELPSRPFASRFVSI